MDLLDIDLFYPHPADTVTGPTWKRTPSSYRRKPVSTGWGPGLLTGTEHLQRGQQAEEMTASTTDVAIIGGGAAGCAVAYYLAEAGVKSTIIEREGIGSQASGFAAGGLNPLRGAGIPGPLGAFAWESFRMHHGLAAELRERTGIDYEFRTVSAVHLALEEDELPGLRETVDLFTTAEGFEAEFLEPQHIAEIEPRITPNFISGVREFGNAALDSLGFTRALAAAAESGGASVRRGDRPRD